MRIADVEAYPVTVPLVPLEDGGIAPYVTNHNELTDVNRVLVRVETDTGVVGWGETRPILSPAVTVSIIEDGIAPIVAGRAPFETESLRRLLFVEYTNVDVFFAPVEIACWDIVGKALDRPLYEILGGYGAPTQTGRRRREHIDETGYPNAVEFAYCLGILDPETSAAKAIEAQKSGYSVLKTKAGRDWREDVARIEAMHEATNGDLEFRLDSNQGWTLNDAVRVATALEDRGIYLQYLEQPIRVNSHRALARLAERTRQPIGPNEDTYRAHNLRRLIEAGAVDVAVLDMTPMGGITGLRSAAAIAEDAGIPVTHHCAFDLGIRTAAVLHAVAGLPGFSLPPDTVYYGWAEDVIDDPFEIVDGAIDLPTDPGLGIDIDMDTVETYRID